MSRSLIRLVDEAILPAFLIVGLKVVAIALVNNIFSLTYYYENFGRIYYAQQLDAIKVNTYSDMIMYAGILVSIVFIVIRLLFFTDDKPTPGVLLKLVKAGKLGFLQTSVELYHTLFVWMVFFTGLTVYVIVRGIAVIDYPVVIFPAVVVYLTIFWIIVKEVEKDIVKKLQTGKSILV